MKKIFLAISILAMSAHAFAAEMDFSANIKAITEESGFAKRQLQYPDKNLLDLLGLHNGYNVVIAGTKEGDVTLVFKNNGKSYYFYSDKPNMCDIGVKDKNKTWGVQITHHKKGKELEECKSVIDSF